MCIWCFPTKVNVVLFCFRVFMYFANLYAWYKHSLWLGYWYFNANRTALCVQLFFVFFALVLICKFGLVPLCMLSGWVLFADGVCHWQVYEDTLEGVYLLLRREMQEMLIEHKHFWQVAKVQMTRVCMLEETAANYVNWKMIESLPYYKSVLLESAITVCLTFSFSQEYRIRHIM